MEVFIDGKSINICDRCGKPTGKMRIGFCPVTSSIDKATLIDSDGHAVTTTFTLLNSYSEYTDICDDCKEKFRTWWNEGRK